MSMSRNLRWTLWWLPIIVLRLGSTCLTLAEGQEPNDTNYAKTLKQFIESPPIIESLKARVLSAAGERFVEIRYQSNGFLVKTANSLSNLASATLTRDAAVAGHVDDVFWSAGNQAIAHEELPQSLIEAYAASNRNPPIVGSRLFEATALMNMGLPSQKFASLKWTEDTVVGTDYWGVAFTGKLRQSKGGLPNELALSFRSPAWKSERASTTNRVVYDYDRQIPNWSLPTTVRIGSQWTGQVLSVTLSAKPNAV